MEIADGIVTIGVPTDVAEARRRASMLAATIGFDETEAGRIAIAVTEAGTNLLKHARGGELFVGRAGAGSQRGLQVVAMDRGRGIHNVTESLRDGFSTTGTSGTGLGAIRRAASTFDLHTAADGTVLAATFYPGDGRPVPIGAVGAPIGGELQSGDGWAAWSAGELTSIFVVDGLGHGYEAARAASTAVDVFLRHAERPAAEVIGYVHDALKGTRGAAVAVAELDRRQHRVKYCGIGNIDGTVVRPDGSEHHLVSMAGIAGHVVRRVQEYQYEWPDGGLLLMHSDGITAHWDLGKYPGLAGRRPDVIAGVVFRDHRRGRDDATVVVTRNEASA